MSYYVPTILENTGRGERQGDVFSRLLKDRIIFIGSPIDDMVANLVIAQMLFLAAEDPEKDISLYINSPGGSITAGLGILDTMRLVEPDLVTYCVGPAASMAAVLLAVAIVFSVAQLVPINNRIACMDPEQPHAAWLQDRCRWDRFHRVRVVVLTMSFVLLLTGVMQGR